MEAGRPGGVTSYLNSAILPAIGHLRVDAVKRADIARWFHHYGQRRLGGANVGHRSCAPCSPAPSTGGTVGRAPETPARGSPVSADRPRGWLLGVGDLARLGATLRDLEPK
ncbi:MAG: hypothetical protein OXG16_09025 [Rhodospirillales bacterium]|nr:hypothetical protein [Rhodospirillales bacterium]